MFNSKFKKFAGLIIVLFVLAGISFYVFANHSSTNISPESEKADAEISSNIDDETDTKEEPIKEEVLNPVQKYYKENLEQDEINFLNRAKTSKDNDIEFSKLQMKFIKAADVLNEKYAENIDIKERYYKNNWVKLSCVEGSYFYAANFGYLREKYGEYLSPAYNEWLKFILKRESVMQDGGLIVPPDTLREYIISLEKFVAKYPDFLLIEDAKDFLDSYLMTYLEGIDNSPIFDKWNTKKLLPEFKASYEKFLTENKDSKYYPMVEELYNKSKSNNFTWDRDFDAWLYEYHKKYFAK